jgi:hypothetical protein
LMVGFGGKLSRVGAKDCWAGFLQRSISGNWISGCTAGVSRVCESTGFVVRSILGWETFAWLGGLSSVEPGVKSAKIIIFWFYQSLCNTYLEVAQMSPPNQIGALWRVLTQKLNDRIGQDKIHLQQRLKCLILE